MRNSILSLRRQGEEISIHFYPFLLQSSLFLSSLFLFSIFVDTFIGFSLKHFVPVVEFVVKGLKETKSCIEKAIRST